MLAVLAFTTRHAGGDKGFVKEVLLLIAAHLPHGSRHCQSAYELDQYFSDVVVPKPMKETFYCDACWQILGDSSAECACSGAPKSATCMLFTDIGEEICRRFDGE